VIVLLVIVSYIVAGGLVAGFMAGKYADSANDPEFARAILFSLGILFWPVVAFGLIPAFWASGKVKK